MVTFIDKPQTVYYGSHLVEIVKSSAFDAWLSGLRDVAGRARIVVRIERLAAGNPGDHKSVGDGILELRMTFGPGYRVYYMMRDSILIVLLAGGDKSTQSADIARAKAIAEEWAAEWE